MAKKNPLKEASSDFTPTGRIPAPYTPPMHSLPPRYMADRGVESYPSMPVQFGRVKATIYGGPFREYVPGQRRLVSVKMAAEINKECDISIPTEDFNVPSMGDMHAGVKKALQAILDGNDLYAGCMGGIGRTGLFMGVMAKVMMDFNVFPEKMDYTKAQDEYHPVGYVRKHFKPHAIETQGQQDFIKAYDTSYHVQWLREQLQPKVVEVEKIVEQVVVKEVGISRTEMEEIIARIGALVVPPAPELVVRYVYTMNPFRVMWQAWNDAHQPRRGDRTSPY